MPDDLMNYKDPLRPEGVPFTHHSAPPVAPEWPPTLENAEPCDHCGSSVQEAPYFQVNLVGPKQIEAGKPPVEVADVIHICPSCGIRSHRRYRAPDQ